MEQFTLVNPETGDAIGTATLMDVYVLMYSLFMHLENKPIEV
jgi:hypothetical protein